MSITDTEIDDTPSDAMRSMMRVVGSHGDRIRGFHILVAVDQGDGTQEQYVYRNWENRSHLVGSLMFCIDSIFARAAQEDAEDNSS